MSLKHAVLALVVERRGYGYDLARRLEERVGPAWRLNPSAIYPALDQLERAGLVTGTVRSRGTLRSTRVVYAATPAGAAALTTWLETTEARPEPVRSDLHLRIAFAQPRDRKALLARLAAHERTCSELLAHHDRASAEHDGALRLVAAGVRARLRAELAWLRDTREAIESGALDEAGY